MNQAGFQPIVAQPRRWDVLADFMTAQGYKTFVEVGCREGRTTGHILKTVPDSYVIAIDPWMANPAPKNGDATREDYEKWDFAEIEQKFWENVGDAKDRCAMLRETSEEASRRFDPWPEVRQTINMRDLSAGTQDVLVKSQFDIIFIDALHDYESVLQDIRLWWPKVRIGGILSGHDANHQWPGVERAIADSFNLMQVGIASDSVWFVVKHSEDQLRASHTIAA